MNYCVIKNTTKVIDGSENLLDVMFKNAINAGFLETEVEILTESEYETRKETEPKPTPLLSSFKIMTDKTEITSDGVDTSTVTITLEPEGTDITTVDILVDGQPVIEIDVINNTAIFEFASLDAGKYMVEAISGDIRSHIFIRVV